MKKIIVAIVFFALLLIFGCASSTATKQHSYAVLLGLNPEDSSILSSYDTVVIDAQYFTKGDIAAVQAKGTVVYTYLNIGSIETFREGYDALKGCVLSPYDNWPDEYWVDVSRPEWQLFIANEAQALIDKGIDGFFLDNADVYYLYPTPEIYSGLVEILENLGRYDKPILMNGGDVFVGKAVLDAEIPLACITGVNQECVFTSIDFSTNTLLLQDEETTRYYQDYLARCKGAGLDVYLTEYAPKDARINKKIQDYCETNDFQYYISPSINLDR
ncbi:MAG: endo alpha-1,4 polygalactosaminidase [Eubacteriales bacterium]|nr:endo alpha-1,4 polygalactosaminidase [Eubacteriales bacterium]